MEITPLTRKIVHIDLKATLAGGEEVRDLTGVLVALVPHRQDVGASTEWIAANFDAASQEATILVVGFEADPAGAIVVPSAGADLYARVVDTPEDDPALIERITYG
jgi:hypothetical protein